MITKKTKRRKSYPAILFSFFSVIFVFGIVGFLIFSNWKTNQQRKEFNLRIEFLKQEISVLSEKKQELEKKAELQKNAELEKKKKEAEKKIEEKKIEEKKIQTEKQSRLKVEKERITQLKTKVKYNELNKTTITNN